MTRLEKFLAQTATAHSLDENKTSVFSDAEKLELCESKTLINDLVNSYGSNRKGSPISLAWAMLLCSFSMDSSTVSPAVKKLINGLFSLAIKENVFAYLLDMFALNLFDDESNECLLWHLKQILYAFLNAVLNTFDVERMSADNLKYLYELTFFCMNKNEYVCENFWKSCIQPNVSATGADLTVLMLYAVEKFPISFGLCLTFFSLISKTNVELCKQTIDYLTQQMDQYCEYLETISAEEFQLSSSSSDEETIRLVKDRKLFDNCVVHAGAEGLISNLNQAKQTAVFGKNSILRSSAVNWNKKFNCFNLMQSYLNRFICAADSSSAMSFDLDFFHGDSEMVTNVLNIIELVNSLFKHFFSISDQEFAGYDHELNTKHLEIFVNMCFGLFGRLIKKQSRSSYRLLTKLFDFFNNIAPHVYDKVS